MIKERLRFKKEHQLSTCSSSAAITARTRNNSSIDTNDSTRVATCKVYSQAHINSENLNTMNLANSPDPTFQEKFKDRLTMGKSKKQLAQLAIREVETDGSFDSRLLQPSEMEAIIKKKVEECLGGCLLLQSQWNPRLFTVHLQQPQ